MLNKRLGQHFLRDDAVVTALYDAIAPVRDDILLEIGPGDGVLTERLQQCGATVIALELDRRFAEQLSRRYQNQAHVRIVHTDALAADWRARAGGGARLVGNLPYNISTPLLLKMAAQTAWLRDCHVMVQKEVAQRVCAPPGGSDYGRLSVFLQLAFRPEWLLEVPPTAFVPPPQVDSAVIRLQPQTPPLLPPGFEQVVNAAFAQRRKTLKNALAALALDWRRCPIDGGRRAQSLAPAEFIQLAQYYFNEGRRTK